MTAATADDLRAAKALIDTPEKWGKRFMQEGGRHCILGAVEAAVGTEDDRFDNTLDAIRKHLPPLHAPYISSFNDYPKTSHADVMALLDRAISSESSNG